MELPRINSTQAWHEFLVQAAAVPAVQKIGLVNKMRMHAYSEIEKYRGRPLIVYVSKFYDVQSNEELSNFIDLADVEGFTDLINAVDSKCKEIDVLLFSPGGRPDATERIVDLLRTRFEQVHFLVPHSAYSAATMLALSGNSITLHPSAVLGPIDPQINGIPAMSIKRGFQKITEIIQDKGPSILPAYIPLIEKYSIELLELCQDSEDLSKLLVADWIAKYMFKHGNPKDKQVDEIVRFVSNYEEHLMHTRPLTFSKLKDFGMPLFVAEGEFAKLLWETHLLITGFFSLTPFVKLFENPRNISWGKMSQNFEHEQEPQELAQQSAAEA
ncbi:MAG: hypothetical protein JNL57_06435 [Bacteroidetes bacterium]|nr:hypothetical protein [Bacteroidota bacterium]